MGRRVNWLAALVVGGLLLVSAASVSDVVGGAPVSAATPVLMSSVQGDICPTAPFTASAQQGASCEACSQCIAREGPTEQCVALCDRLECDPQAPGGRCDVVGLCVEGYRWDANACRCVADPSGN